LIIAEFPEVYTVQGGTFEELLRQHMLRSRGWLPMDDVEKALDEMVFLLTHFGGYNVTLAAAGPVEDRARRLFLAMDRLGVVNLSRDDGEPVDAEVVEA